MRQRYAGERPYDPPEGDAWASIKFGVFVGLVVGTVLWGPWSW